MLARTAGATLLFALSALAATDLRLLDAVKRRDHQAVTALLSAKVPVDAARPDGATALAWAAYLDDTQIAEKLLGAGAKPNTADEYGETPLTLACANGNATLVRTLLAAGADANTARWDGETALMIAAGAGSVDAVNSLVARGANLNAAESRKGQTALMWAAAERHPEVVKTLIAQRRRCARRLQGRFHGVAVCRGQERQPVDRVAPRRGRRSQLRAARRLHGSYRRSLVSKRGGGEPPRRPRC